MSFITPQNAYTANTGLSKGIGAPHYDVRAPAATDIQNYFIGQQWIWPNGTSGGIWELLNLSTSGGVLTANWVQISSASGDILAINGTANQITATTTAGTTTLSIPATFIAPGSIAATTTVTGGTGVTAITGNITASGVGSGLVLTPTIVAAGASPQIVNGRVGQVTFSGVSIASGATQTFVITNSAITGSGTVILYSWFGATAGSALSISSVTNSAGSSSIVMTNGTSATMVTDIANITFVFEVLN